MHLNLWCYKKCGEKQGTEFQDEFFNANVLAIKDFVPNVDVHILCMTCMLVTIT